MPQRKMSSVWPYGPSSHLYGPMKMHLLGGRWHAGKGQGVCGCVWDKRYGGVDRVWRPHPRAAAGRATSTRTPLAGHCPRTPRLPRRRMLSRCTPATSAAAARASWELSSCVSVCISAPVCGGHRLCVQVRWLWICTVYAEHALHMLCRSRARCRGVAAGGSRPLLQVHEALITSAPSSRRVVPRPPSAAPL